MIRATSLVAWLKHELKLGSIIFANLASRIRMSEVSVKRVFSLKNFTLQRRADVLRVINIDFYNIALNVHDESLLIFEWGFEQEK